MDEFIDCERVRAVRRIFDNPLAKHPSDVERDEIGDVQDVLRVDGLVVVDFGRGAVLCSPDEIRPA
jgi:hypothetical protein